MNKGKNNTWSLIKSFLLFVPLIGLIAGYFYHQSTVSQYRERLSPNIDCRYEYYYFPSKSSYKFIIDNSGLIKCKDIWAKEEIYLIIDGEVYRGDGVPHFNYFVYNGSRTHMWDLKKGEKKEINLDELQIEAFYKLKEKFDPMIISRWEIICSTEYSSERYRADKYFIFDFDDRAFKAFKGSKDFAGRMPYEDKIKEYSSLGSKMNVDIYYLTGDFEINPPLAFIVNPDYSVKPLYAGTKIKLEEFVNSICFYLGRWKFPSSDDVSEGSIRYVWRFENGRWEEDVCLETIGSEKPNIYLKPIYSEINYLLDEDAKRLKADPTYIHTLRLNLKYEPGLSGKEKGKACISSETPMSHQKGKEEFAEIIKKAREKYLDKKNNPK